jgi:serine protease
MVAGVAALMLSRDPLLTNAELISRLRLTSRVFPAPDPTLLACSDPAFVADANGNWPNDGQCNCDSLSCGEGMLDAGAAVRAATNAVAVVLGPASAVQAQAVTFDGSESLPAPRGTLTSYSWTIVSGPAGGAFADSGVAVSSFTGNAGLYTLRLEVADSVGTRDSYDFAVNVEASSGGGDGGGGALSWLHLMLLVLLPLVRRLPR